MAGAEDHLATFSLPGVSQIIQLKKHVGTLSPSASRHSTKICQIDPSLLIYRVPLQNLVRTFFLKCLQLRCAESWEFGLNLFSALFGKKLREELQLKLRPELPPSTTETLPKPSLCRNPLLMLMLLAAVSTRVVIFRVLARHSKRQNQFWRPQKGGSGSSPTCPKNILLLCLLSRRILWIFFSC